MEPGLLPHAHVVHLSPGGNRVKLWLITVQRNHKDYLSYQKRLVPGQANLWVASLNFSLLSCSVGPRSDTSGLVILTYMRNLRWPHLCSHFRFSRGADAVFSRNIQTLDKLLITPGEPLFPLGLKVCVVGWSAAEFALIPPWAWSACWRQRVFQDLTRTCIPSGEE